MAEKLNKSVNRTTRSSFLDYLGAPEQSSIFLEDTTVDEVYEIIKEFRNDKLSDIPICVIKHCAPIISPILSNLYNKHMRLEEFSDMLKTGRVRPIYKKAEADCIANYRLISTYQYLGKYLKELFTHGFTALYHLKISSQTHNLASVSDIVPVTPSTTQLTSLKSPTLKV